MDLRFVSRVFILIPAVLTSDILCEVIAKGMLVLQYLSIARFLIFAGTFAVL